MIDGFYTFSILWNIVFFLPPRNSNNSKQKMARRSGTEVPESEKEVGENSLNELTEYHHICLEYISDE